MPFAPEEDLPASATRDGGTITISFTASEFVNWSAVRSKLDSIAVGQLTQFAIRTEPLTTLLQESPGSMRHVTGDWELAFAESALFAAPGALDNAFDKFNSTPDGDYGLTLNGPEFSGPSVNSDLSVIPAPLPAPNEQPGAGRNNEGGQIALTPFIAPTGLTLADGYGAARIARAKHQLEELREAPTTTRDAGRLESLRGRAVVYEIADASGGEFPIADSTSAGDSNADHESAELVSFNEIGAGDFSRLPSRVPANGETTVVAMPGVEPAAGEEFDSFAAASANVRLPNDFSLNGDAVESSMLDDLSAADRDEAFSAWPLADSLDPQASAPVAPHAAGDRRMIGAGVAVAISFVPLRKALRRRYEQALDRELPRRS
jgi:hypothetical protein